MGRPRRKKWIKVTDGIPAYGVHVLVFGRYGREVAFLNERDGWILPNQLNAPMPWIKRDGVTHWRPLPPPPNEEELNENVTT